MILRPKNKIPLYKSTGFGKRAREEVTSCVWLVSISQKYKRVNGTNLYCRGIRKIEHNLGRWK